MATLTEYWQELVKDSDIPKEKADAILEALGDESVSKTFQKGFRTQPEFSRGLDKNRADWEGKLTAAEQSKEAVIKWHHDTAMPEYRQNQAGVAKLQQYIDRYGLLEDGSSNDADASSTNGKIPKDALTRRELEGLLTEREDKRDQRVSAALKQVMRVSTAHMKRFGEELTDEALTEVETIVTEKGISLSDAYDQWTAPRIKEQETDALKAKFEKEKAEAVRDALSKHNLPVENREPQHHTFFNPAEIDKTMDADQRDRNSRNEFAAGWNEA